MAITTVLGVLETARGAWLGRATDPDFGWVRSAAANMPWWYLWAALVPVVAWVCRKAPMERGRLTRSVPWHLLASVALSGVHLSTSAVAVWLASSHRFQGLDAQLRSLLTGYLLSDLVTYWAVATALTALAAQRRLRWAEDERNRWVLEAAALEAAAARMHEQMTEARLRALRSELNPHFLYNVLHGVSALARAGDADAAVTMLARLGELLRRTLDSELEPEITLAQELELLELYLAIERVRYGGRMSVRIRCSPEASEALVPSFLLQPLVENAVCHGVAAVRRPVGIEVDGRVEAGRLVICVGDSGPGLPEEGALLEGVGLGNTRRRLAASYGDDASLTLVDSGEGTRATVLLPLRRSPPVLVSVPA